MLYVEITTGALRVTWPPKAISSNGFDSHTLGYGELVGALLVEEERLRSDLPQSCVKAALADLEPQHKYLNQLATNSKLYNK